MMGQRKKIDLADVEKRLDKRLSARARKLKPVMKVSGAGVKMIQGQIVKRIIPLKRDKRIT